MGSLNTSKKIRLIADSEVAAESLEEEIIIKGSEEKVSDLRRIENAEQGKVFDVNRHSQNVMMRHGVENVRMSSSERSAGERSNAARSGADGWDTGRAVGECKPNSVAHDNAEHGRVSQFARLLMMS